MGRGGKREGAGAPRKVEQPVRVSFVMDKSTADKLAELSEKTGKTRSALLRRIVESTISRAF